MARNLVYYEDPDEERRRRKEEALLDLARGERLGVTTERLPRVSEVVEDVPAPKSAESYDPATAANPFDDAPAAVDPKAASVPEAQKGTPSARLQLGTDIEAEMGWADVLLDHVRKRVLDRPDAAASPLNQKAEAYAMQSLDPRESFSVDRAIGRVGEVYEDVPPSTRWEDEFNSSHKRLTDRDVERAFLLQSLMHGTEHGMAFRQMQRREQAGYEEGVAKAREADRRNTRIDRGLAEAIAATGQISPEAAARLTYGSDLVKNYGQYASQGRRAEGQALGRDKALIREVFGRYDRGEIDARQRDLEIGRWLNNLQVADIRGQAAAEELDPAVIAAMLPAAIHRAVKGISREQAERAAQGDKRGLTPEQEEQLQKALPFIMQNLNSKKGAQKTADAIAALETTGEAKGDIGARSAAKRARAVSPFSMTAGKERTAIRTMAVTAKRAREAWDSLSPEAQELFVQVGPKTPEAFANAFASLNDMKGYQAAATNLRSLTNQLTRQMAGLSQTESELTNQLKEQGLATEYWDPFKDTGSFSEALDRIEQTTRIRYQSMKQDGSWDASEPE